MIDKVPIRRLPTGVPGLDAVLGGGVSEFSFNVIAGTPGAGKTTLVQRIMSALDQITRHWHRLAHGQASSRRMRPLRPKTIKR